MKSNRKLGLFLSSFAALALGVLTAHAQTNFYWTNSAAGTNWSVAGMWSNENVTAGAPAAGGSSEYTITFQNTATLLSTNNLGNANFNLNSLVFSGAGAVTLQGLANTNLVFTNSAGGVLPTFIQNSAGAKTINLGLVLATNLSFLGTGAGAVTINSILTV